MIQRYPSYDLLYAYNGYAHSCLQEKNEIKSYKIAKIQFFKELEASILLVLTESPDRVERFRQKLKYYILKI